MNKSKLYQHKIVEMPFDQAKLNNFSNERGLGYVLTRNATDDRIVKMRTEIINELYGIIHGEVLTDHQRKILLMRLMGKTQNQIADHFGITQSAVHKAMHGNIDYKNNKKRYGGIVKKLKKICNNNEKIQQLLCDIDCVRNSKDEEE